MKLRAVCPACDVVRDLRQTSATSVRSGTARTRTVLTLAPHRSPIGGMCLGSGDRVARSAIVHPCADCAALPEAPGVLADVGGTKPHGPDGPEYRPANPRQTTGTKPPLCFVHRKRRERAQKAARRAAGRVRSRGLPEDDRGALWAAQGERCGICWVPLNVEKKAPELDHDHDRAAGHDHPDDQVCRACARGLLCRTCNLHVVGRLDLEALGRAVAWRLGGHTAAGLGWWPDQGVETHE